ncbi:MAG TPA: ethanolamine ammonia-lyase reactivating factor EutA [Pirellulales bacterium]|nr:ethanolamine ammonia-lyase reactivating factor EutA [Pirellulales bacterium]
MTTTSLRLLGLDFGSTTTSGVLARAKLVGGADRRSELTEIAVEHRSEPVFTPFCDRQIDEAALAAWLDEWSRECGIAGQKVDGGGAMVTGLAARAENAGVVRRLVQERFGAVLMATADDSALESWLTFMANCRDLSLADPAVPFLNLDIGGGTTNVALGEAGQVRAVGCYHLGARHVRFMPGSYRLAGLSDVGRSLFAHLGLSGSVGGTLGEAELSSLLDFVVGGLEAVVEGRVAEVLGPLQSTIECLPLRAATAPAPIITLSGGVGELAYRAVLGEAGASGDAYATWGAGEWLPGTTAYGDLGIDLAKRICRSPLLARDLRSHIPSALGRATVLGLAVHQLHLSGATLFLPDPTLLPLAELPIVGRIHHDASEQQIDVLLDLVRRAHTGGCIVVDLADARQETVRSFGQRLSAMLTATCFPCDRPLVLLVEQNVGKALGNYATRWRSLPLKLLVLDELPDRGAAFVTLGRPHDQLVPVSFYGW